MAKKKKQVNVKSYRRKDGTIVRSSNRSVMTVGDKNVNKRQNTLGGHIRKGATVLGAIGGASGAIGGALLGGAVAGPIGAGVGAASYGASGAFGGGISGAGYGAGTYYLKKRLAKDRSKRNFDYKKGTDTNTMYEFARPKGSKDRKPRRKKQNTLKGHVTKGAKISGTLGAASNAASSALMARSLGMNNRQAALAALGGAVGGGITGSISGGVLGAGVYGGKKALAKDRSKKNFDYTKDKGNLIMFIGNIEKTNYEFARPPGAQDKKPRNKRSMLATGAKIAGGAAAIGATGLALKNAPKAVKTGMRVAKSAKGSLAGQNSTNKLFGVGAGLKAAGASLGRNMGKDVRRGASAVSRGAENLRAKTARAGYRAKDSVVNQYKKRKYPNGEQLSLFN